MSMTSIRSIIGAVGILAVTSTLALAATGDSRPVARSLPGAAPQSAACVQAKPVSPLGY